MSAVRSRRSSDKALFVRTQVARYFLSLLICNLVQAVGTLFNLAWFVDGRVEIGTACTAQATITELGNVRKLNFLWRELSIDTSHDRRLGPRFFHL